MLGMIFFGLGLLIAGAIFFFRSYRRNKIWIETEGAVHSYMSSKGSTDLDGTPSTPSIYEVIVYKVRDKEVKSWTTYSTAFPYAIGTKLTILYNPDNYTEMSIKTFSRSYLLPAFMVSLGFFLLLAPVFSM